jgi:hypothetical protein
MHWKSPASARTNRFATIAVAACAVLGALSAGRAAAQTTIESFEFEPSTTQAGGHPDLGISFALDASGGAETPERVAIGGPPGVIILPTATYRCSSADFATNECSPGAQVGVVTVRGGDEGDREYLLGTAPVYLLQAASGQLALLAFTIPTVDKPVLVPVTLKLDRAFIEMTLEGLPQSAPIASVRLSIWGFPAGYEHDHERFVPGSSGSPPGCPELDDTSCIAPPYPVSNVIVRPFTLDPPPCGPTDDSRLSVLTYEDPTRPSVAAAEFPSRTGCDQLSFDPSASVQPTTTAGYAASGIDLDIRDPQFQSVTLPSPSPLEWTEVALPAGMGMNPDLPAGLPECTAAEARIDTEEPAACPPESRLGSALLETPTVVEPIPAEIFLGTPWPEGQMRLIVAAEGGGVSLKLLGMIEEEASGGVNIVLGVPELPDLPISDFQLHLSGGEGGLFRTPVHCGEYESEALFAPWDEVLPVEFAFPSFSIESGPGGGPCIGNAATVGVRVDPATITADGRSGAKVTVAVRDADGTGVPAERIKLSSSDHGQRFGKLTDNEDGTYSALLTGSTTPGANTITATDLSVSPPVSGSTTLTQLGQLGFVPKGPPPRHRPVVVRLSRKPARRITHRRASFAFRANLNGTSFICRLDHARFRPCKSPVVLRGLSYGTHRFAVRGRLRGNVSKPAIWRFRVIRPRRHRHRARTRHPKHSGPHLRG